jgi:CBS domain-containing protein
MQVLEIMKTHVVKTTPDATLAQAVDLLDLYQSTGLPVIDAQGVLCGMLTESDILRAARRVSGAGAGVQCVADWMSSPAISVRENESLQVASLLLLREGLKRLPVTTEDGRVVGVLNRIDLIQAIFEGAIDDVFPDER